MGQRQQKLRGRTRAVRHHTRFGKCGWDWDSSFIETHDYLSRVRGQPFGDRLLQRHPLSIGPRLCQNRLTRWPEVRFGEVPATGADRCLQRECGARETPGAHRLTLRGGHVGEPAERMEDAPLVLERL